MSEATEGRGAADGDTGLLAQILERHPPGRDALLGILQQAQELYGYLPAEALEQIAQHLEVPWSKVYAVATFYPDFHLEPRGKHAIRVCCGTACHVRGGRAVLSEVRKRLGIDDGGTTPDGLFSLDTEACLGACAVGPAMTVGETSYGRLTPDEVVEVLERHRQGESETGSEIESP